MSQLIIFDEWGFVLLNGRVKQEDDRAIKYYLEEVLPTDILDKIVAWGFRYFKYVIVRDQFNKLPQYSTQRCPAGYPIMTVLVVSKHSLSGEHPEIVPLIKQYLDI